MKVAFLPALLAAVALGGCSTELDGFGSKPSAVNGNRVMAAPSGSVETSSAPAPVQASTTETASDAISARTTVAANVPLTPPPANPGGSAYAPTAAKEQMAGAWSFGWDNGRYTCPVSLSTNRGLYGLAAQADVSCPSEIFMTKGWEMMGPDLVLQNHQGKVTVRLQPSGPNRYVGVITETNQPVVLMR